MLQDLYIFDHNFLHICFWTLPSILVGLIMAGMTLGHNRNQKKRQKDFEQEMAPAAPEKAKV